MKVSSALHLAALSIAIAAASGGAWAQTSTVNGSNVNLLTDPPGTTNNLTANSGSAPKVEAAGGTLGQFNASLGVLTGATATLAVPTTTTNLTQSQGGNAVGTTSVTTTWSLGGNTSSATVLNSTTAAGIDSSWNNLVFSSSAANLNNFVGAGNLAINSFSTTLAAVKTDGGNSVTATVSQNLVGAQSVAYSYLAHSNASFASGVNTDTATIDFGNVSSGVPHTMNFNVFEIAGGTGLTFTSAVRQGGSGPNVFSVTGGTVAAGGSGSFLATLNAQSPLVLTNYSETYRLTFTDYVASGPFASTSLRTNYIDVTITAAVPEPGTYAMILAGLSAMGFVIRRRRPRA